MPQKEKVCRKCLRRNPVGTEKCWWCGGRSFSEALSADDKPEIKVIPVKSKPKKARVCDHQRTLLYPGIGIEWCKSCGAFRDRNWRETGRESAWRIPGMSDGVWEKASMVACRSDKNKTARRKPESAILSVDKDGWTKQFQISIGNVRGGYRLAGPKYNGSSEVVKKVLLTENDAKEIRRYLDEAFPNR